MDTTHLFLSAGALLLLARELGSHAQFVGSGERYVRPASSPELNFVLPSLLISGIDASTGKCKRASACRPFRSVVSCTSSKNAMANPRAKPPATPPRVKTDFLGNEGPAGRFAGSRTWNCSPCWRRSRSVAMADWSRFLRNL